MTNLMTLATIFVVGLFGIRLLYNLSLGYMKMQRRKGNEKYLDEDNFEKYKNWLSFILICTTFAIFLYINKKNLYKDDAVILILFTIAIITGITGAAIYKLIVPYIEREFRRGNPKISDEYHVNKIVKILKIISTILVVVTVIIIYIIRFMRWHAF